MRVFDKPWLDAFLRDERGSLTIEFILWIPLILALVVIVINATTLYVTHSEMWNVARDVARQMSTGVIGTIEEAEICAANGISLRSDLPYYIRAEYDQDQGAMVIIGLRLEDTTLMDSGMLLLAPIRFFANDLTARVVMRPDPQSTFGTAANPNCLDYGASGGNQGNGTGGKGKGKL